MAGWYTIALLMSFPILMSVHGQTEMTISSVTPGTNIRMTAEILTQTISTITMRLTVDNEPTDVFCVCKINGACMEFSIAPDQTSVDVVYDSGLTDMTCYNFTVGAKQGSTNSSNVVDIEGCTSPRHPVEPEQDTGPLSATTARISWKWFRDCTSSTSSVEFKATLPDGTPVSMSISRYNAGSARCYAELQGLISSTDTVIRLYATFKNITGIVEQLTVQTTLETPYNCSSFNSTSTSVVLQWTAAEGMYDLFRILYTGGAQIAQPARNYGSTIQQYLLEHLQPGQVYNIDVRAYWDERILLSEPCTSEIYTLPAVPTHLAFPDTHTDGFTVTWDKGANSNDDYYEVTVKVVDNSSVVYASNETNTQAVVDRLQPATQYQVFVVALRNLAVDGVDVSLTSPEILFNLTYTRPTPPPSGVNITDVTESSIVIQWHEHLSSYFEHYSIDVSPDDAGNANIAISSNITTYTVSKLTPGISYTVSIYTVVSGLRSETPISGTSYTVPELPESVPKPTGSNLRSDGMVVSWSGTHGRFSNWHIYILNATDNLVKNFTVDYSHTTFEVGSLTPGTLYTLVVFTSVPGFRSQSNITRLLHTRPHPAENITLTSITNTTLTVTWEAPSVGHVDEYRVVFVCQSPNEGRVIPDHIETTSLTTATVGSLDPGTLCTVMVTTYVDNEAGDQITKDIYKSTLEEAPEAVAAFLVDGVTNTSLDVHWRTPSVRNGIIRRYELRVLKDTACVQRFLVSCNDCTAANQDVSDEDDTGCGSVDAHTQTYGHSDDQHNVTVSDLHPYRNYSIMVIAYTVKWGASVTNITQTQQGVPGIPRNFSITTYTHNEVEFTWRPPSEINGETTGYRIVSSYKERLCGNKAEGDSSVFENLIIDASGTSVTFKKNIYPYWNYSFYMIAANMAGYGSPSDEQEVRTLETNPDVVDTSHMIITNTTATGFTISWDAPCYPNGIITNYNICLSNDSSVQHGESLWSECYSRTPSPTTAWLDTVIPYRNYSVTISAQNSIGFGAPSTKQIFVSDFADPDIPSGIRSEAISSSAIQLTWSKPDRFTGPTSYTVTATDVQDTQLTFLCQTNTAYWTDQLASSCVVSGLDAYWEYSLVLNATVLADGDNMLIQSSSPVFHRTNEAIPGKVVDLQLAPESNVTTPITIKVSWQPPTQRDLNGVLTGYMIYYKNEKTAESLSIHDVCVDNCSYVIRGHISTYTIQVAAINGAGIGLNVTKQVDLEAYFDSAMTEDKPSKWTVAVYAGIAAGVAVIIIVSAAGILTCRRQHAYRSSRNKHAEDGDHVYEGLDNRTNRSSEYTSFPLTKDIGRTALANATPGQIAGDSETPYANLSLEKQDDGPYDKMADIGTSQPLEELQTVMSLMEKQEEVDVETHQQSMTRLRMELLTLHKIKEIKENKAEREARKHSVLLKTEHLKMELRNNDSSVLFA